VEFEKEGAFDVTEISDTSLRYDRDVKLPIYAEAAIPAVWILDLVAEANAPCPFRLSQ
jgi:hypothetical protein